MIFSALFALLWAPSMAAEPGGIDGRLRYERALEAKADRLLDDVLGPRRARVFVDATLDQSVTEESVESLARDAQARGEHESLPGFRRPASARRSSTDPEPLRRLSVRLVADPGLNRSQVSAAEELVRQTLGVLPERGDEFVVVRAPLRETWSKLLERPGLRPALAAVLGFFILAAALVLFMARAARNTAVNAVRQIREERLHLLGGHGGPVLDAVPALPAPDRAFALDFVTARNLRLVSRFLETRPPSAARWVLGSLDPETAASLFRLLPTAARQAAALELAAPKAAKPPAEAELKHLVEELRAFLEHEAKGTGLLQELLVRSPEALRKAILDSVKLKAPASFKSLQTGLIRFEDLERADVGSLALLARETTSEDLAVALRGCRHSLCERLLAPFPAVLRDSAHRRLLQKGTEAETLSARAAILARWRELEATGKVRPL